MGLPNCLHNEAEAVVIAAPQIDALAVGVVEVKIAGELVGGGVFSKAAIAARLVGGQ